MPMLPPQSPAQAIEQVVREEWGRILAALVKSLRDIQLAEDCLQDAVARAMEVWQTDGPPRAPAAWLITTARRKAIDRLRRDARFAARVPELSHLIEVARRDETAPEVIPDQRLEMIFTCCHPALEQKTRVALTLRTLCGLTTEDIAAAFLDKPTAMAQRLVRAKQKIAGAAIPYRVPDKSELPDRLGAVLTVIYLIFNQGYSTLDGQSRRLTNEALRLGRTLRHLLPDEPEVAGLLALMLLHDARHFARRDSAGELILLEDQNRNRWDRAKIKEGDALLREALALGAVGPYQIQAAISGLHTGSPSWEDTDWAQIAALYALLFQMQPTPVVQVNHAVAVSYARSTAEAIALLEGLDETSNFARYQPYHAACASLYARHGDPARAQHSYDKAIDLSDDPAEQRFLRRKRDALS